MPINTYKALVVKETETGKFRRSIIDQPFDKLPDHDVLVNVHYSSLNYKDALSATGNKGVTQSYPHTPGIDAAGVIEQSDDDRFKPGDHVIATSYDLGQNTNGGFGQYIRIPGNWVVPLPNKLTLFDSMALGTAGLTAAIGVHHLRYNEMKPGNGPVFVTGATGGVGTLAISIPSKLGYEVTAATGKMEQEDFLTEIGAASVIHRKEVQNDNPRPLLSRRWAAAIDTVGGLMLDTTLRQTQRGGTVACCGNVLGHELHTSIYPFILRGVHLAGIDSGRCPMELRTKLWNQLAADWRPSSLEQITRP